MPVVSQNTVTKTLPADGCVLNFFGLGDPGPTHDSELYPLAHTNEAKSHLQSQDAKEKSSFDLKHFNMALHTDALVAICSSLRDLRTQWAVSLPIPKRSYKIVETLPCAMPNACAIYST